MLSVTIITHNEAKNLPAALASVSWADEIVIIDSESTDDTVKIAKASGAKVVVNPWQGYANQKNFADSQTSKDWILNIDADERVTNELQIAIKQAISKNSASAFYIKRLNFYLGRWLKHSGWYPDYQLRLYKRGSGIWRGEYVHESFCTTEKIDYINADLLHYSINNLDEHHERLGKYTTLAAAQLQNQSKNVTIWHILFMPIACFLKSYIIKLGILDGIQGLIVSFFAAYYVFLKYAKYWETNTKIYKQKNKTK